MFDSQQKCLLIKAIKDSYTYQDSELNDVILEVKDDHGRTREIAASSFILSVRSPYFKKVLFGSFQESSSKRVKLTEGPLKHRTVQSVVHFLYTDEIRKFDDSSTATSSASLLDGQGKQKMQKMDDICDLVCLFNAAQYFEIEDLINELTTIISNLIRSFKMTLHLSFSSTKAASVLKKEAQKHVYEIAICLNELSDGHDIIYNDLQEILILAIELQLSQPTNTVDVIPPNILIMVTTAPHLFERAIPKIKARADDEDGTTTTDKSKKHWLLNLDIWSKQSSEHLMAAKHVLKIINSKFLDTDIIEQLKKKGTSNLVMDFIP